MKISCDMALDLADSYISGAASEDTKDAVDDHLAQCSKCREYYDKKKYKKQNEHIIIETSPYIEEELLCSSMDKISKRLRRRKLISDSVKISCIVITLIAGIASLVLDIMNKSDNY